GHFLAARRRGLKVDRFSIGFGPKIFGWTRNGVEYRISLLPLGGYVALPQLADMGAIEGGDSPQSKEPLPPIGYADKMIVSVMGAVFNIIFAFLLAIILWQVGQPTTEDRETTVIGYVPKLLKVDIDKEVDGPAYNAGLRPGDKVLAIDDVEVSNWGDIQKILVTGTGRDENNHSPKALFAIERNGKLLDIPVYPQLVKVNPLSGDAMRVAGVSPAQTVLIGGIMEHSPAAIAGLKVDDIITHANGQKLYSLHGLSDMLNESPHEKTLLTVERKGETLQLPLLAEQVPYTKPLASLNIHSGEKPLPYIHFLPLEKNGDEQSTLIVFEMEAGSYTPLDFIDEDDTLIALNGKQVHSLSDFNHIARSIEGNSVKLEFLSFDDGPYTVTINKPVTASIIPAKTQAMIGIELKRKIFLSHINPIDQFKDTISMTLRTLASLISRDSDVKLSNLMGPPGIIRVFHTFSSEDLRLVIWFTIFVNINLAILNLLPIPVLDGGHMAFATIGKLMGRPLPPKLVIGTQSIFMFLLFSLMIYVSFFDVRRWQGDQELERRVKRQQALYVPIAFEDDKS
ncbi:MAG: hypothetical protein COY94_05375, partial [Verrucomicrobia bacterium CG_4_10_14_0_8_um_filter_43_34]